MNVISLRTWRFFASLLAIIGLSGVSTQSFAETPAELARWLAPQAWVRDLERPVLSLGKEGEFDDMHLFAPAVAEEKGRFLLWYSGSRGTPGNRVFRLGLAESADGLNFEKHQGNPVLEFQDAAHSVLTPALLRKPDGSILREEGKLRLWFTAAKLGKGGLHTLRETSSADGVSWAEPSPSLLDNVYCPSILKTEDGYQMWYSDVSQRPWLLRHASSADGTRWKVTERPVLRLSQSWEAEVLVYPTVVRIDGVYLMWYGSYDHALRRETTAIGFAASLDGQRWHKHPQNPVLRPDPERPWESNYVGSGSVLRLSDGSFRYWYASRKKPPFVNLYYAINTVRWLGPAGQLPLRLPPRKGDIGVFEPANAADGRGGKSVDVLEVIDKQNVVVRAWYVPTNAQGKPALDEASTFVDLWVRGVDTTEMVAKEPVQLSQVFQVVGNEVFDTTCGKRSLPLLEPVEVPHPDSAK